MTASSIYNESSDIRGGLQEQSYVNPYRKEDIRKEARKNLLKIPMRDWSRRIHTTFQSLRHLQAYDRSERRYDQILYNGKQPLDDTLARVMPKYSDLRWNSLRQPIDWLMSEIEDMNLRGTISPAGGYFTDEQRKNLVSEYDKRLKSVLNYTNYDDQNYKAIKDAAICGEGFLKIGLRRMAANPQKLEFYCRHVDWDSVWVDSYSTEVDLSDADNLFLIKKMKYRKAIKKFGHKIADLSKLAFDQTLSRSVYDYQVANMNEFTSTAENYENLGRFVSDVGDPDIYIGKAYLIDYEPDTGQSVLLQFTFAYDDSLENFLMLSKEPQMPYGHNRIPFVRVRFDTDFDNKQPYSPLIRDRRGKEKSLTYMMRIAMRMVNSRSVVVDKSSIEAMGQDPDTFVQNTLRNISNPTFVQLREGKDSMEIYHNVVELEKITKFMEFISAQSERQTGIAEEARGKSSPSTSGRALEEKREQGLKGVPELLRNIRTGHQWACQMILSIAEQYTHEIFYGDVVGPAETSQPVGSDGDFTIEGNAAIFTVNPRSFDKLLSENQANTLSSIIQQTQIPNLMARLMPILVEGTGISDSQRMIKAINQALRMENIEPVPALLSEQERIESEKAAKQEQAKREELERIQKQGMIAEVEKTESEAILNLAKAEKEHSEANMDPDAGKNESNDKEEDLRRTIRLQANQGKGLI